MKASDSITDEMRNAAIELAHEMLADAMEKTRKHANPMLLVLACSHFMAHLIDGAPDEATIKDCVLTFLKDLDVDAALKKARDPKVQKKKAATLDAIFRAISSGLVVEEDEDEKPVLH